MTTQFYRNLQAVSVQSAWRAAWSTRRWIFPESWSHTKGCYDTADQASRQACSRLPAVTELSASVCCMRTPPLLRSQFWRAAWYLRLKPRSISISKIFWHYTLWLNRFHCIVKVMLHELFIFIAFVFTFRRGRGLETKAAICFEQWVVRVYDQSERGNFQLVGPTPHKKAQLSPRDTAQCEEVFSFRFKVIFFSY